MDPRREDDEELREEDVTPADRLDDRVSEADEDWPEPEQAPSRLGPSARLGD